MQKRVFRVYLVSEKYVFRVCFESPEIQVLPSPEKIFMIRNIECKNIIEGSEEGSEEGSKEGRRSKSPIVIF